MKTINEAESELAVAKREAKPLSSLDILEAAVKSGITSENVAVVREIIVMRREEVQEEAKNAFAMAFFKLRKAISTTQIYADKAAQHNGNIAYTYCSEEEISKKLEPLLFEHGFAMLFSQRADDGRTVAIVKLIHERGHSETQEFSVRVGSTNAMKDATAADAGSTTTAWRHLMIKMFGLKSRIRAEDDVRNEGDPNAKITKAQADELEHRCQMVNFKLPVFFRLAGADSFGSIPMRNYQVLDNCLREKERMGR
jgi:hypothetical protein